MGPGYQQESRSKHKDAQLNHPTAFKLCDHAVLVSMMSKGLSHVRHFGESPFTEANQGKGLVSTTGCNESARTGQPGATKATPSLATSGCPAFFDTSEKQRQCAIMKPLEIKAFKKNTAEN